MTKLLVGFQCMERSVCTRYESLEVLPGSRSAQTQSGPGWIKEARHFYVVFVLPGTVPSRFSSNIPSISFVYLIRGDLQLGIVPAHILHLLFIIDIPSRRTFKGLDQCHHSC